MAQNRRQEVVERTARRQHEAGDAFGVLGGDPLGDRAEHGFPARLLVPGLWGADPDGSSGYHTVKLHVTAHAAPGLPIIRRAAAETARRVRLTGMAAPAWSRHRRTT